MLAVMGIIGPRDPSTLVQAVLPLADQLIFTRPRTPRALDPAELTRCVPDLPCRAVPRLADALDLARRGNNPVLVTGSLYLVGEARALLLGEICDPVASWDPLERIIAPQQT